MRDWKKLPVSLLARVLNVAMVNSDVPRAELGLWGLLNGHADLYCMYSQLLATVGRAYPVFLVVCAC